jgi:hypothetical protein
VELQENEVNGELKPEKNEKATTLRQPPFHQTNVLTTRLTNERLVNFVSRNRGLRQIIKKVVEWDLRGQHRQEQSFVFLAVIRFLRHYG